MTRTAHRGAAVFDGTRMLPGHALLIDGGRVAAIVADGNVPENFQSQTWPGGVITPGFVDLQVNGGGGVMVGAASSQDALVRDLETIALAHNGLGVARILPTLITAAPQVVKETIAAVSRVIEDGVEQIVGLHLEGPHLAPARKGAHDPELIRPMADSDLRMLIEAAALLPTLKVTLAPEAVTLAQIEKLASAGVIVFLGHSDCTEAQARAAVEAGATGVTHLFNAMSGLGHRAPGLAGVALDDERLNVGLIADGIHVSPTALRIALQAAGDRIFLVSDAMAVAGTNDSDFVLGERVITRRDGQLTLEDGTLAGADLSLSRAIQIVTEQGGFAIEDALAMATSRPAAILRNGGDAGHLRPGSPANAIHVSADFEVNWLSV